MQEEEGEIPGEESKMIVYKNIRKDKEKQKQKNKKR